MAVVLVTARTVFLASNYGDSAFFGGYSKPAKRGRKPRPQAELGATNDLRALSP
jgi:hypothetical protein